MDDIAAEAGLTKPTLYQYFPSKDDLFLAIMAEERDHMLASFDHTGDAHMVAELHDFSWHYAEIVLRVNGRRLTVDSRPSDAIALAVRARVPVYVADEVMEQAGITPEDDLEGTAPSQPEDRVTGPTSPEAFREFLEGLDLSGLE